MKKKGISLIVLVITIIVMIILAATVVVSLSNTGIIDKATAAKDAYNLENVKMLAESAWAEAYAEGARTTTEIKAKLEQKMSGVDLSDYEISVTPTGVVVNATEGEGGLAVTSPLNEYGFYYDYPYYFQTGVATYLYSLRTVGSSNNGVGYIFHKDGSLSIVTASVNTNNKYIEIPLDVLDENIVAEYADHKITIIQKYEDDTEEAILEINVAENGIEMVTEDSTGICNFEIVKDNDIAGQYVGYMLLTEGSTTSKVRTTIKVTSSGNTYKAKFILEINGKETEYNGQITKLGGGVATIANVVDASGTECPYVGEGQVLFSVDGNHMFVEYMSGNRNVNLFGAKKQ